MNNIIDLPNTQTADELLNEAKGNLQDVLIVGYDRDGDFYLLTDLADTESLWLLETAKKQLMEE